LTRLGNFVRGNHGYALNSLSAVIVLFMCRDDNTKGRTICFSNSLSLKKPLIYLLRLSYFDAYMTFVDLRLKSKSYLK